MLEKLNKALVVTINPKLNADDWRVSSNYPEIMREECAITLNWELIICINNKFSLSHAVSYMKNACKIINEQHGDKSLLGPATNLVMMQILNYIYLADVDDGK